MFYVLRSVVLGTSLSLNLVSSWPACFGVNPINFLKIAGVLLADFGIAAHDVGYEELLALLDEIRIQQLYLVVVVDEEELLDVL